MGGNQACIRGVPVLHCSSWDSEAEANRDANPPPGWTFFLPDSVPGPAAGFTCTIAPVHAYQLCPMGALGPQALTGQADGA